MRTATKEDLNFIAQCFVDVSQFIKSNASDIYIDGLPDIVDKNTLNIAASYIHEDESIAFIKEIGGKPIACLLGKIETTSFPPSGIGRVGHIAICWVSPEFRHQNIGSQLVREAENWFTTKGIDTVELSYMAENALAKIVWKKLGYKPFRVFAHKVIKS